VPENATRLGPEVAEEDLGTAGRLRIVVARLSRRAERTRAGAALTPSETSVLASIVRQGPMRLSDLASAEGMNPTMLSRLVNGLENAGLVARRADQADHRGVLVEATARGRRLQWQIRTERTDALSMALQRLSPGQRAAVELALPALEALAEELKGRRG
jgi:DNA-binding MarR family transcriptional regulator